MSAMRTATVEELPATGDGRGGDHGVAAKIHGPQIPQKAIEPNTQTTVLRQQTAKSSEKAKKTANCKSNKGILNR